MKKSRPQYQQNGQSHGKDSAWMAHDRKFFRKHPRRSHHLRRLLRGELQHAHAHIPPHDARPWTHVVIRQLESGVRLRCFVEWPTLPDRFPHWETFFSLVWDAVMSGQGENTRELMEQARQIDRITAANTGAGVLQ